MPLDYRICGIRLIRCPEYFRQPFAISALMDDIVLRSLRRNGGVD